MMLEPIPLVHIMHPFAKCLYVKKEFDLDDLDAEKNILVVEGKRQMDKEEKDKMLTDFLSELDLIRDEVERTVGSVSRVDIRYY